MPKVSVVIPTRNRARVLVRAVRSVLGQTCGDFELLIVDDASTDGTGDAVRRFDDPRIVLIRHEVNRGVSAARNSALDRAAGAFVAFLDDDDEWLPEKLERQLTQFDRAPHRVGMMCSGYYELNHTTNDTHEVGADLGRSFADLLRRGSFSHTSTIMVRAECFARTGPFDLAFKYGEDFDMWLRIAREYTVDAVAAPLSCRHVQSDGLTQDYDVIISGAQAYLAKYREYLAVDAGALAEHLHRLATYFCFAGDTKRGRRAFLDAIAQRPRAKSYVCGAIACMGPRVFRWFFAMTNALRGVMCWSGERAA